MPLVSSSNYMVSTRNEAIELSNVNTSQQRDGGVNPFRDPSEVPNDGRLPRSAGRLRDEPISNVAGDSSVVSNTRSDTPQWEELPTYGNVAAKPPAYSETRLSNLLKSRRVRVAILALILLAAITSFAVVMLSILGTPGENPNDRLSITSTQPFDISNEYIFPPSASRHIAAAGYFAVVVMLDFADGTTALLSTGITNNTWGYTIQTVEPGVSISYVAIFGSTNNTILALNTTKSTVSLVQIKLGRGLGKKASPQSLFNLTNATSNSFVHPVAGASMFLSNSMKHAYVALADNSGVTWIYRIRVPEFVVEASSAISASVRGTYRFAESSGFADPQSTNFSSSVMMLPNVPVQSIYDAYAFLQPHNLSLILPFRRPQDSTLNTSFVGVPFRGSMSPDGSSGILIAGKSSLTSNGEITGGLTTQVCYLFPKDWSFSFVRNSEANVSEVLVHSSGRWTIEAQSLPGSVNILETRDSSKLWAPSRIRSASMDILLGIRSLASAGDRMFYSVSEIGSGARMNRVALYLHEIYGN
ncbi:hypothetical protein BJ742DRAFT_529286 [Cladochytrium replicatum]|nr:hypothetical protein BJ742DRAFT_529286 [Cladochytrium replicatum]